MGKGEIRFARPAAGRSPTIRESLDVMEYRLVIFLQQSIEPISYYKSGLGALHNERAKIPRKIRPV
jgi:hypothetical protein